jgi:site-specific recombinase XerD
MLTWSSWQTLLGRASLDTTRRYLDATAEGLREVVRGHPGQVALRDHLRGSKS